MTRTATTLTVAACLAAALLSPAALAQGITVLLNGETLPTSTPPMETDGHVMVAMRDIFEALQATIEWNDATQTVTATLGETEIQLTIGEDHALLDGRTVPLDAPAVVTNGTTMVPLRFVAEATGADVRWNGTTRTVSIATGGATQPVAQGGPLAAPTVTSPTEGERMGPDATVRGQTVPGALVVIVTRVYKKEGDEFIKMVPGIRHNVGGNGAFEYRIAIPVVINLDPADCYYDIDVSAIKDGVQSESTVIRVYR